MIVIRTYKIPMVPGEFTLDIPNGSWLLDAYAEKVLVEAVMMKPSASVVARIDSEQKQKVERRFVLVRSEEDVSKYANWAYVASFLGMHLLRESGW